MQIKKSSKLVLTLGLGLFLAACGNSSTDATESDSSEGNFDAAQTIHVISREDGSGTRGAFTEITKVLEKNAEGNEEDKTYMEATIQNSTDGVMTSVMSDTTSIGYISLGSLNDKIKAVEIEGVQPTATTIKDGSYAIARPFNVAYKDQLNKNAQDFWDFMFSQQGQEIIVKEGYVESDDKAPVYTAPNTIKGKISVVGSTSVTSVMEVLAEEYQALNPDVTIDITSNGSSAGVAAAIDGTADIGMASRELKEEEKTDLTVEVLAMDGIAVIVNNENPIDELTMEQVKDVFTGKLTSWEDLIK
ncbi:MAG: substrate-binding domain-containing protein [Carnobacterium sp.]|uniref:substrate-binding domain-containing protein n=1 Tax=Carnobacterium sp. TaxID=48221 RepID=UPI003C74282C